MAPAGSKVAKTLAAASAPGTPTPSSVNKASGMDGIAGQSPNTKKLSKMTKAMSPKAQAKIKKSKKLDQAPAVEDPHLDLWAPVDHVNIRCPHVQGLQRQIWVFDRYLAIKPKITYLDASLKDRSSSKAAFVFCSVSIHFVEPTDLSRRIVVSRFRRTLSV